MGTLYVCGSIYTNIREKRESGSGLTAIKSPGLGIFPAALNVAPCSYFHRKGEKK